MIYYMKCSFDVLNPDAFLDGLPGDLEELMGACLDQPTIFFMNLIFSYEEGHSTNNVLMG